MWVYVGRRLLLAIPTLLGASIIVFAMVHLAPGDPISAVMPAESSQACTARALASSCAKVTISPAKWNAGRSPWLSVRAASSSGSDSKGLYDLK